jgi:hypothetical protein
MITIFHTIPDTLLKVSLNTNKNGHHVIQAFKRQSRLGIVTEIRQHVKFVYLMSFNNFQLARVNQLFSLIVKVNR